MKRRTLRSVRYFAEAILAWSLYGIMWLLPLDIASATGGWIGRTLGRFNSVTNVARNNLKFAFPEMPETEREKIITEMWDNLGRVGAEFPHLPKKALSSRITIEGGQYLDQIKQQKKTVIFISGHLGNWEMAPKIASDNGLPLTLVYRPANNPWVEYMFRRVRSAYYTDMFAKGASHAIRIAKAMQQGHHIGMLVDQKMNDGIPVPFFGRDAMTVSAVAALAIKFDMLILPARVVRTQGAHFIVKILPPYAIPQTGDMDADIKNAMVKINNMLEEWIREYPAQWFWLHNRWPKE